MRLTIYLLGLLVAAPVFGATVSVPAPEVDFDGYAWQVARDLDKPSFAYFYKEQNWVFVANIQGSSTAKDNGGWIDVFGPDGKLIKQRFATGLDAPRGMVVSGQVLWVADIDRLVRLNAATGQVQNVVELPDAQLLSGLAVDTNGRVFAADPMAEKVFVVDQDGARVFLEGPQLERPTGIAIVGSDLIISAFGNPGDRKRAGRLLRVNMYSKVIRFVTSQPIGHLSSVDVDHLGSYLVSDWLAGKILRVSRAGVKRVMYEGLRGAGGLTFVPELRRLIVPRTEDDALAAFDLERHPDL